MPSKQLRTVVGPWHTLEAGIAPLRHAVFVAEQGISAHLVCDAADQTAVHAVTYNAQGQVVASGRLLVEAPGVGRIGRMATAQAERGKGLGRQVLHALLDAARERHDHEVMLHAQSSAVGFYLKDGFTARGPEFMEAGIVHQEMVLALR